MITRKFRTSIIPFLPHNQYWLSSLAISTLRSHTSSLTFTRKFSSLPNSNSNPPQTSTPTTPTTTNNNNDQNKTSNKNRHRFHLFQDKTSTPKSMEITDTTEDTRSLFQRILDYLNMPAIRFITASRLYDSCKEQAGRREFLEYWNLDDNFRSWFVLNLLHVWICMVNLRVYERDGKKITKHLFDLFWEETEKRLVYVENIKNPMILSKNLNIIYRIYHGSVLSFDEGMISSDMVLADAIWRNVFSMNEQFDKNKKISLDESVTEITYKDDDFASRRLFAAVEYVRRELQHLELARERIFEGTVKWSDPINPVVNR